MEILWPSLAIAVIVVFVFFVLAQHWGRLLRHQTWTIRRLADRVMSLEEMADPTWRRKLSDASPVPLEQVFNFSFNLGERFWRESVCLTDDDRKYVRDHGSFVGAVKLERWRSHTVVTVSEVLPDRKATGWQTRTLDFYPDQSKSANGLSLWELMLSRPGLSAECPPFLELFLRPNSIELRGHLNADVKSSAEPAAAGLPDRGDILFFRVPLDSAALSEFRSHDPADSSGNGSGNGEVYANGNSWKAFYSFRDDDLGIDWQLRLRDLTRKSEWERWKVLESHAVPVVTRD
jgi:hypothetical protein